MDEHKANEWMNEKKERMNERKEANKNYKIKLNTDNTKRKWQSQTNIWNALRNRNFFRRLIGPLEVRLLQKHTMEKNLDQ